MTTNLTNSIEERDEIVTKLGGYDVVRDLAVHALTEHLNKVMGGETYGELAERLRGAVNLAEALERSDGIASGDYDGPIEYRPEHRELHAARMLVHALDTSGSIIREYLSDALYPAPTTADWQSAWGDN